MAAQRRTIRDSVGTRHMPHGPLDPDAIFQPIKCGGGIAMPGPAQTVDYDEVCVTCRTGQVQQGYGREPLALTC